jgi:Dihydrodipicolinate synthetase family
MDPSTIAGIWPILYAFFDASGRVDRSAMRRQIDGCVAGGAHGVAVMGHATEVGKLDVRERRQLMEWVAEDLDGRKPLAVTLAEPSVDGQVEMARFAERLGAGWVILQPPPVAGLPEAEYVRFLGAVADRVSLPLAVQNAPRLPGGEPLQRRAPGASSPAPERLPAEGRGSRCRDPARDRGHPGRLPRPERARGHVQVQIFELMRTGRPVDEAQAERSGSTAGSCRSSSF